MLSGGNTVLYQLLKLLGIIFYGNISLSCFLSAEYVIVAFVHIKTHRYKRWVSSSLKNAGTPMDSVLAIRAPIQKEDTPKGFTAPTPSTNRSWLASRIIRSPPEKDRAS